MAGERLGDTVASLLKRPFSRRELGTKVAPAGVLLATGATGESALPGDSPHGMSEQTLADVEEPWREVVDVLGWEVVEVDGQQTWESLCATVQNLPSGGNYEIALKQMFVQENLGAGEPLHVEHKSVRLKGRRAVDRDINRVQLNHGETVGVYVGEGGLLVMEGIDLGTAKLDAVDAHHVVCDRGQVLLRDCSVSGERDFRTPEAESLPRTVGILLRNGAQGWLEGTEIRAMNDTSVVLESGSELWGKRVKISGKKDGVIPEPHVAIAAHDSRLTLRKSVVNDAGGIEIIHSELDLDRTMVKTAGDGVGLKVESEEPVTIRNSTISGRRIADVVAPAGVIEDTTFIRQGLDRNVDDPSALYVACAEFNDNVVWVPEIWIDASDQEQPPVGIQVQEYPNKELMWWDRNTITTFETAVPVSPEPGRRLRIDPLDMQA